MYFLTRESLKNLYSSGLSMADIAIQQKVSVHKVAYWMNKYKIPRRNRSDASYIKQNPKGDPFNITEANTIKTRGLLLLTIGLFLGEGNKKNNHQIRFANSDSKIIQVFLNFLRKFCLVREDKIRAVINIFDDISYEKSLNYWVGVTSISTANFYKPTIRPGKIGTYKNKSKYGTITILVSNKKLLDQVKAWCSEYLNKYAEVAQW